MTTPHEGGIEAATKAYREWKTAPRIRDFEILEQVIAAYVQHITEDEEVINNMAKVIADSIGHGMREKCIDAAKMALRLLA